jgi:hypothetical protein
MTFSLSQRCTLVMTDNLVTKITKTGVALAFAGLFHLSSANHKMSGGQNQQIEQSKFINNSDSAMLSIQPVSFRCIGGNAGN